MIFKDKESLTRYLSLEEFYKLFLLSAVPTRPLEASPQDRHQEEDRQQSSRSLLIEHCSSLAQFTPRLKSDGSCLSFLVSIMVRTVARSH